MTGGDPKKNLQQLAERMFSPWEAPATNITLRLQYHYWVITQRLNASWSSIQLQLTRNFSSSGHYDGLEQRRQTSLYV